MQPHNEYVHARQTATNFNVCKQSVDGIILLLQGKLLDGSIAPGQNGDATVDELKAYIRENLDWVASKMQTLKDFLEKHEPYNVLDYTTMNKNTFDTAKTQIDSFKTNLLAAIDSPSINNSTKLANLATVHVNNLAFISPVEYKDRLGRAVTVNDLLDASSYVLHDINPDTGVKLNYTDEQKRGRVEKYLTSFFRLYDYNYPSSIQSYMETLHLVAEYVSSNLQTMACDLLGKYIDENTEKIPALRRLWAL